LGGHLTLAAGAKRAVEFDRDMDAGKMRRQRATIDPPLAVLIGRLVGRAVLPAERVFKELSEIYRALTALQI
jgi:hypothetical protein